VIGFVPLQSRGYDDWGAVTNVFVRNNDVFITRDVPEPEERKPGDRWVKPVPSRVLVPSRHFPRGPVRQGVEMAVHVDDFGEIVGVALRDPASKKTEVLWDEEQPALAQPPTRYWPGPVRTAHGAARSRIPSAQTISAIESLVSNDPATRFTTVLSVQQTDENDVITTNDGSTFRHPIGELETVPNVGARVLIWDSTTHPGRSRGVAYDDVIARYADEGSYASAIERETAAEQEATASLVDGDGLPTDRDF
jgi:hypothetical protein